MVYVNRHRNKNGFTLVELMVVVVIVGVLASLAVARYRIATQKFKIAEATLWCNRIAKAIDTMGSETGEYPGHTPAGFVCYWAHNEVWDLNSGRAGLVHDDPDNPFPEWNGPYINKVPLDPWGNKYAWDSDYYLRDERKWVAAVISFGPNGRGPNHYDDDNIIVIVTAEELPPEYYE
ncbi:prepilin-type N-terminal cleavage/methylation domain-containing protein [bacterium]|nr:prepilin-type N-terminal cleavage/methylation domain-containing protein [bacterium]